MRRSCITGTAGLPSQIDDAYGEVAPAKLVEAARSQQ